MRVETGDDGQVAVTIAVPAVIGGETLASFTDHARFEPQR
jgi:predicted ribosomally synthesized peptide with SipW-like signal peptide